MIVMRYEIGSEYILAEKMMVHLDEKPRHPKKHTRIIPVGALLLVINPSDESDDVWFSYESENYRTLQGAFDKCTRRMGTTGHAQAEWQAI